jgi:hypothetical protein
MTWSYSAALAADKDRVRLLVGDTDASDPQLQDEELNYLIAQRGDVTLAAADAARALVARYSRQVDTSNLSLSVSASKRAEAYRTLAEDLDAKALSLGGAEMFVGGLTISGKETLDSDTSAVQPSFSIGQDDLPGNRSPGGTKVR